MKFTQEPSLNLSGIKKLTRFSMKFTHEPSMIFRNIKKLICRLSPTTPGAFLSKGATGKDFSSIELSGTF